MSISQCLHNRIIVMITFVTTFSEFPNNKEEKIALKKNMKYKRRNML